MQATPIHFMTVREQADLLASGEITSVALTQHFLDRAAELDSPPFELPSEPRSDHDGMLATMVTIAREHALEAAAQGCAVAGVERCAVAQVERVSQHARARGLGLHRRTVRAAVVDDHDRQLRMPRPRRAHDVADAPGFTVGRDD